MLTLTVKAETALDLFTRVMRIRRFEEAVQKLVAQGQLPGVVHLYIGEEAVSAGVCAALRDDDYIVSTHRGHGHVIAKGGDSKRMMAELFGKISGNCHGKGGSQHIADFSIGMFGACGIVGGAIPIAVGAAFSAKYRGTDQVAVSFFGDGASNEGSFHESLNLASVQKMPVVFVCENNGYGEFTPQTKATSVTNIADRSVSYGIPGVIVDGTDPVAVYEVAGAAVSRAGHGEGPTLIEAKTHRRGGHAEGENAFLGGQTYRPAEEVAAAQQRDPLAKIHEYILANRLASAERLTEIDAGNRSDVDASIAFARASAGPPAASVLEDVWA
jgi:acetoin:2,6-dichlorophenolindophenol oxidoreductase subunit alpha